MKRLLTFFIILLFISCTKEEAETPDEDSYDCECEGVYTNGYSGVSNIQYTKLRLCELSENEEFSTLASGALFIKNWSAEKGKQVSIDQGCQ